MCDNVASLPYFHLIFQSIDYGKRLKNLCCRSPRTRGFGNLEQPQEKRLYQLDRPHTLRARSARRRSCAPILRCRATRICDSRCRSRGRNHGQQHLPRRFHLPEPANPAECHRREFPPRREEAPFPWKNLHLSARCCAAHSRKRIAHLSARIHQRALRNRQDCRAKTLRELQSAIWH